MDLRKPSPFFSVSPPINPADADLLASQGFRTSISNRPDGESEDQPGNAEIQAAAQQAGLEWHFLPVVSGNVTDADAQTSTILFAMPGDRFSRFVAPVPAVSRSGPWPRLGITKSMQS